MEHAMNAAEIQYNLEGDGGGEGRSGRAVFWDRDGTLMEEVHYCSDPALVRAIPGAGEAMKRLRSAGWLNVIVSNQSGIGRGRFTVADYEAVNRELFRQLGLVPDGAFFCPDDPAVPSKRRKPAVGMVEEACAEMGIDPRLSWFVGDKDIDVACGKGSGCRTILVLTGYGREHRLCGADLLASDAAEAGALILGPAR